MEVLSKRLNLDVEKYYSTELDEYAKLVTSANYGNKVTQLGDLKNISESTIKAICPIDLLIGGTPCQDLSNANAKSNPFGEF